MTMADRIYRIHKRIQQIGTSLPLSGSGTSTGLPPVVPIPVTIYSFNQLIPIVFEDF